MKTGHLNSIVPFTRPRCIALFTQSSPAYSKFLLNCLTLDLALGCKLLFVNGSALQIGEVAARSGVSIDTVRYYERRQLLPRASRSNGGFRLFPPDTVERVQFIKHGQEMGLSLEEIAQLLATRGG